VQDFLSLYFSNQTLKVYLENQTFIYSDEIHTPNDITM